MNRQWRYDQLVASDRFTLSHVFKRAGWRTVDYVPANDREWPQGSFYGFDKVYDQRNLGYVGPRFGFAPMPDQRPLGFATPRAREARRGPFADRHGVEPCTVDAHPELIDWGDVGNGSVFNTIPVDEVAKAALWGDRDRVRAAYGRSIEYLNALVSFVQRYGDEDLVLVLVGDHQPSTIVTGLHPDLSHDVPISVVAHDPAVLDQIAGGAGRTACGRAHKLRPPMDAFRDRFLSAFGTSPTPG